MNPEYLFAIPRKPSESYPKIEIIGLSSDTWYAGSYSIVTNHYFKSVKADIVNITNGIKKRRTIIEDWDWHHVVESQHIVFISVNGNIEQDILYGIPTILIHKPEHRFFSRNTNNNAFRTLSGLINEKSNQKLMDIENLLTIKNQINQLRIMYRSLYIGYPTLQRIVNNVFDLKNNELLAKMPKFGSKPGYG